MKVATKTLIMVMALGLLMSFANKKPMNNNSKEDPRKELDHFPKAQEGMVRYVIFLDKKSNEDQYKIELIPGKVINVDCNIHRLMGETEEKDIKGWGYTYYEFSSDGKTMSTRKGCPGYVNKDKFISAQSTMLRYNSKLPIVVYVPKGFEVKYKVWKAGKEKQFSEG